MDTSIASVTPELVLYRAADIMVQRGLCQDHDNPHGHCVVIGDEVMSDVHVNGTCIGTAIDDAFEEFKSADPRIHQHAEAAFMLVTGASTPREFNDDPDVDLKDCVDALRFAAYMSSLWYGHKAVRKES